MARLRRSVLASMFGLALFSPMSVGCAAAWPPTGPHREAAARRPRDGGGRVPAGVARDCPPSTLAAVVAHVNDARRRAHLRPLVDDRRLMHAAHARASAMAASSRLTHAGWERVVRGEDAVAAALGENVAYNYPSADAVMDAWLRSPGHRANILATSFRRIGVGCVVDGRARLWWAQDFAD